MNALKIIALFLIIQVSSTFAEEVKPESKVMTTRGPVPAGHVVETIDTKDLDLDVILDSRGRVTESEEEFESCGVVDTEEGCSSLPLPTR